jgi:hypothetical protein
MNDYLGITSHGSDSDVASNRTSDFNCRAATSATYLEIVRHIPVNDDSRTSARSNQLGLSRRNLSYFGVSS